MTISVQEIALPALAGSVGVKGIEGDILASRQGSLANTTEFDTDDPLIDEALPLSLQSTFHT
jgi:hypothetical protein